ncbi:cytochrome c [Seleniivibrio woodruffii]|uniref:cytochrome c n=2 Tax=Seleniivibrio woodruffii TaxID=1078050 RepID=UPI00240A0268|nr:cytochrome c [Seleniivibrio woodruffii]
MLKKIMLVVLALAFTASTVFAFDFNGGDGRKGKRLWKRYHTQCADGKTLPNKVGASTKTQAQWKDAFNNPSKLPCGGKWADGIKTEEDMQNVFRYLFDHAADSDQPETCG